MNNSIGLNRVDVSEEGLNVLVDDIARDAVKTARSA